MAHSTMLLSATWCLLGCCVPDLGEGGVAGEKSALVHPPAPHPLLERVPTARSALIGLIWRPRERSCGADPNLVIRLAPSYHPALPPRAHSCRSRRHPHCHLCAPPGPGHALCSCARPRLRGATLLARGDMRLDPQAALALGLLRLCLGEWPLGPAGLGGGEGWVPALPGGTQRHSSGLFTSRVRLQLGDGDRSRKEGGDSFSFWLGWERGSRDTSPEARTLDTPDLGPGPPLTSSFFRNKVGGLAASLMDAWGRGQRPSSWCDLGQDTVPLWLQVPVCLLMSGVWQLPGF